MELEGIVHDGVIVPDDANALAEGTRVRILVASIATRKFFGERYGRFKGAASCDLPADLADQHEHYRLGTPKR